jgi:TolA-binding protein
VDKAYKNDPLGQEAKLRNARLSYFRGEFDWAKAQLDVLKSATSQLIANDALALSLLISDNTALDTSTTAMEIYSRADLLSFQNHEEKSIQVLDSLMAKFPGHTLTDEALYKKAQLKKRLGQFTEAAGLYREVFTNHPKDILADDAMFALAELEENQFKNNQEAQQLYGLLMEKYPGSLFVVEARKRFRTLRGDLVN